MSEVASRPSAPARGGRGAGRGGRGGARGSTRGRPAPTNGTYKDSAADDFADQGELGEMKKLYSSQLPMLKELFSDWTDVDLCFALQETDGDLESTVERISEGHVSRFSDVKSTKEKAKPKPKEDVAASASARPTRGRGGLDAPRGAARGRGDRGRGGFRGGRGATHSTAPGSRAPAGATSTATADSNAWGESTATDAAATSDWATATEPTAKAAPSEPAKPTAPAEPAKKTWAQMFAKPAVPAPVPVASKPAPEPTPAEEAGVTPSEISDFVEVTHSDAEPEETAQPLADETTPGHEPPQINEPEEPAVELTPSKDQLTKENVEHLPDVAQPAPTGTAASTVESSRGPDSVTPSVSGQPIAQAPIGRPPMGGFATTALKATSGGQRSASFNRRLAEQQEAVVMPGHQAVDRTAVQFGRLGLGGDDVDEDREELETRAQPPQHSPVAAPRASLPPVPRQQATAAPEAPAQESPAVTKPAPGLPPAPVQQQPFAQQSPSASTPQAQPSSQAAQGYGQFSRYGQADSSAQKQYDPFSQQVPQQGGYGGYPSHSQAPDQSAQAQGGYSSSANDYSSYYTADQRQAYSNYYNSYGQQAGAQDAGASQQRTGSAFGAAGDSGFPSSQASQMSSRYGDHTQSGNNTPNPTSGSQQHGGQGAGSHSHQPHAQQQHGGYPGYNTHPYYNSPYYASYMNQYASPYGQQGFGGPFNKGGMHNQPHYGGYGSGYDQHSSSPGNVSGFGRDTGLGGGGAGGLSDYGRAGSAQPSQGAQSAASGFGGADHFGQARGGFPGQGSYGSGAQGGQQGGGVSDDALKPFGDSKGGPSPSALGGGQPGRPGSATNTGAGGGQGQSGLPPPQSHQQGYGGFPGGHQQGFGGTSQYGGGLGGLGGHTAGAQSHQGGQGGYGGSYGGGFGGSNYGSYGGRGGWGQNYGH